MRTDDVTLFPVFVPRLCSRRKTGGETTKLRRATYRKMIKECIFLNDTSASTSLLHWSIAATPLYRSGMVRHLFPIWYQDYSISGILGQ